MKFLNTIKTRLMNFNKKVDDYQEAITFSEAGVPANQSQEEGLTCVENQGHNLVVATQETRFTDDMIDYALEMAKRMNYDIIAMNAANITHDVTEFFSTTHDELYQDFKQTAEQNALSFKQKAEELGLKFAHTTSFSNIDQALDNITKECGQVEFVITENREKARVRESSENTQRIAQRLCVYSVN